jgi:AAA+ ATPase superfamily predicted ATPase
MEKLVGRTLEKKTLDDALLSQRAELIAIYGRRRVGKTFLVRSAYQKHLVFEFTGVLNGKMGEQLEN